MDAKAGPNPRFLTEEELRLGMELLFQAHRSVTGQLDTALAAAHLGHAHFRVMWLLGGRPGLTVTEVLSLLHVTKQSLGRTTGELLERGLIQQQTAAEDRRRRVLSLTPAGRALEAEWLDLLGRSFRRAYRLAGAGAVEGFRTVLLGLVRPRDRAGLSALPEPGEG